MQRLRVVTCALMASLVVANVAHATKFSILLGSAEEPACVVGNPLYQGPDMSADNPLYSGLALILDPKELWQGAPATLSVFFHDSLPKDLPPAPKGALVFGITLTDAATGNDIHQLLQPVTLAIEFGQPVNPANYIFSSLNETTGVWGEFQQGKPKDGRRDIICGKTDHLSYFYIAAVPEPSTLALAALAGGLALTATRRRSSLGRMT